MTNKGVERSKIVNVITHPVSAVLAVLVLTAPPTSGGAMLLVCVHPCRLVINKGAERFKIVDVTADPSTLLCLLWLC